MEQVPGLGAVSLQIAMFTVAAFAIDRIAKHAVLSLEVLPLVRAWFSEPGGKETGADPGPAEGPTPGAFARPVEQLRSLHEKKRQVAYFLFAGALGVAVAGTFDQLQILSLLVGDRTEWDVRAKIAAAIINGLVLMGGADIASMVFAGRAAMGSGSPAAREADPVQLTVNVNPERPDAVTMENGKRLPADTGKPTEKPTVDH